jgi:hypothetical protein
MHHPLRTDACFNPLAIDATLHCAMKNTPEPGSMSGLRGVFKLQVLC